MPAPQAVEDELTTLFGGATACVYVHLAGHAHRQSLSELGPAIHAALSRAASPDSGATEDEAVSLLGRLVLKRFSYGVFCGEVRS